MTCRLENYGEKPLVTEALASAQKTRNIERREGHFG